MDLVLLILLFHAFFLLGDKIRSRFGLAFSDPLENVIISSALGLIAFSCLTTLLAFCGWIYPATVWTILVVTLLAGARKTLQLASALPTQVKPLLSAGNFRLQWFDVFNLCALSILFFFALTLAHTPPTRTDALVYHLAIPRAYLENHGIVNLPNNMYSLFPLQMEMLFLFCLALKGEILAQLTGFGMLVLMFLAMILFYRRNISKKHTALVPVLFFSTPTFFEGSVTAYVDVAVAGFMFFAYYSWDRMRSDKAWILPLAVFAGAAAGTKLMAGIVLPIAIFGILLQKKNFRETLKPASILMVTVLIFLLPWWAKNYSYSGNPFAPLFMQVFGGEDRINWDADRSRLFEQFVKSFGMGRHIKEFILLPIHLTFFSEKDGPRFDGQTGILYFLFLPGLLFLFRGDSDSKKNIISLSAIFIVLLIFWFCNFQYIRFLASPFVFLTLLLTRGFEQMTALPDATGRLIMRLLPILASVAIAYNTYLIAADWTRKEPLPYLLGRQTREQYLAKHIPAFPIYQAMNRTLNDHDIALFVYMRNLGYLCEKKFISDSLFEAHTLKTILTQDASIEGISRQMRQRGITYLMFDNDFVFGNNPAFAPDQLDALKHFLNSRAKLVEGKNGFYLFHFMLD